MIPAIPRIVKEGGLLPGSATPFFMEAPRRKPGVNPGLFGMDAAFSPLLAHGGF